MSLCRMCVCIVVLMCLWFPAGLAQDLGVRGGPPQAFADSHHRPADPGRALLGAPAHAFATHGMHCLQREAFINQASQAKAYHHP